MSATSTESSEGSIYVMGRTSEEYERLRRQSELLEPATRSVLTRAGLGPGMSCLDVGCGPGEVMRLMAEHVGPDGRVVGIDVDGKVGREALAVLRNKGYRQCSFVEGTVDGLEQIDSDGLNAFSLLELLELPGSSLNSYYGALCDPLRLFCTYRKGHRKEVSSEGAKRLSTNH
jgi:tRNA A58 N-methylase Trm61